MSNRCEIVRTSVSAADHDAPGASVIVADAKVPFRELLRAAYTLVVPTVRLGNDFLFTTVVTVFSFSVATS